ncbi:universal stress protein [Rubrobacter tropicus]|uniref:universal stress protein n=1 Tax=Rubrobacter tropicus TaxID=2653851 RepID=UPI00140B7911|nr:universal stress protein [Rubrobacter tropicus]
MTGTQDGILRPNRILLATDGSSDADLAARAATDLARKIGAELHVAHAWHQNVQGIGYPAVAWADYSHLYEREARKLLASQVDAIEAAGGAVAEPHLLQGRTIDVLLDLCEELQPGLLVMGSRGLGPVGRLVVGSVSEGVVHHAHVPVLVVRGGEAAWPPLRVISGDDGSEGAGRAAKLGTSIAALYGAGNLLVRAHRNPPEPIGGWSAEDRRRLDEARAGIERNLDERADALGRESGRRPEIRAMDGDATLALLVAAEDSDETRTLISVGSRGLGVIGRARLGSVSTNILRVARGPVLICPLPREPATRADREAARGAQPVRAAP